MVDHSSLRTIFASYVRPHWRRVTALCAILLITIGLRVAGPLILRSFIDSATHGGSLSGLLRLGVLFLGVALVAQVFVVLETYVAENLGWLATNRLRADLCLHCLTLDPSFHNAHSPGELIERIDGDVTTLGNFFSRFVVYILGNTLLLAGIVIMLFGVNWQVGGGMLVFLVLAFIIINNRRNVAVPHWTRSRQASAELMGFIEERVAGTEDIRSSGAVAYTLRGLAERQRALLRTSRLASVMGMTLGGTMYILFAAGTALGLGIGAYLYSRGQATLGTVYLIFNYTQMLEDPIDQINRQLQDLQQAGAGLTRVRHLLAVRSTLTDGPVHAMPGGALAVAFDDVSFAYEGDGPVLEGISFQLEPGETLGVLGRTGSGKTTISRLLFRLYDPSTGAIRVGGIDPRVCTRAAYRSRIGMVTQEIHLFHASVRDNLTLFDPTVPDEAVVQVLTDLGLGDWYASLPQGLDTLLASGTGGLSAGEGQLLAFARVFLRDPGVVILDEASSRLDPATEARIGRAVDRLLQGRTGIIIAHRLGTIRRVDRVLILDEGHVVESGERAALAANPHSRLSGLLRRGLEEGAA